MVNLIHDVLKKDLVREIKPNAKACCSRNISTQLPQRPHGQQPSLPRGLRACFPWEAMAGITTEGMRARRDPVFAE